MLRNKPAIVIISMLIGAAGLLLSSGCQNTRVPPVVTSEKPHGSTRITNKIKLRPRKEETVTVTPGTTQPPESTVSIGSTTTPGATTTTALNPPASTSVVTQTAESSATPQAPARTLNMGDTGEDVRRLQVRLTNLGYSPGQIDGDFSEHTYYAVVAFQKVNGLARDGVVGPATLRALSSPKTISAKYRGDHIEVDKKLQVLLVVKNGGIVMIIAVSTGRQGLGTPSVSSAVDWKAGHIYHSIKYGGTMVWASFFYSGVAVHGYQSVPPYPASHGCVRIPIPDSKYVYDNMPVGSMVYVY